MYGIAGFHFGAYVNAQMNIKRLLAVPFALSQSSHWET